MKNKHLIQTMRWLGVPLHGDLARKRNRIVIALNGAFEEVNKIRISLLEKHADKDADGKPILEEGNYKLSPDGIKAFNEDYETPVYDADTTAFAKLDKPLLKALREILSEKLTIAFDIPQGAVYDEVLTFLEGKTK